MLVPDTASNSKWGKGILDFQYNSPWGSSSVLAVLLTIVNSAYSKPFFTWKTIGNIYMF